MKKNMRRCTHCGKLAKDTIGAFWFFCSKRCAKLNEEEFFACVDEVRLEWDGPTIKW
jgi:endogenous inhibitor of DNA gyrase (YacG/DUF329 family)